MAVSIATFASLNVSGTAKSILINCIDVEDIEGLLCGRWQVCYQLGEMTAQAIFKWLFIAKCSIDSSPGEPRSERYDLEELLHVIDGCRYRSERRAYILEIE